MPRSFKLEPGAMIRLCALTVLVSGDRCIEGTCAARTGRRFRLHGGVHGMEGELL